MSSLCVLVSRMDAAITEDFAGAGFQRPNTLTSKTTSDEAFGRWLGLCHTSAPFEFYASRKELKRMANRSRFFAAMLKYNRKNELHIPVPVYMGYKPKHGTLSNLTTPSRTAKLCDIVSVVRPDVVLPFGHPARHFPLYNTPPAVNTPSPSSTLLHDLHRPIIALDMSVFMCACRILTSDPSNTFPDYPFSSFLERRIGEFLHVANSLWSEYLVVWAVKHLCTDNNVFRFLRLLQVIQLGLETPWGHMKDLVMHRSAKLSSYTIYGIGSVEWCNDLPSDIQTCSQRAQEFRSMELAFWEGQYLMHGSAKSRSCVFCNGPLNKFHPDTHSSSLSVDVMPCCLATAHRSCVYEFVFKCWVCPHKSKNKQACLDVRDCALKPSINPWNSRYCTRKGKCPRCATPYVQGAIDKVGITPAIAQFVYRLRRHLLAAIRLYDSAYGADCVFNQLKFIAHTVHDISASS